MQKKIILWIIFFFWLGCCLALPQETLAKKAPWVGLTQPAMIRQNGEFIVSVLRDGQWREAGRLGFDKHLREQRLDLSAYLPPDGLATIRISEQGGGAAHIDAALLGGAAPTSAAGGDQQRVQRKLGSTDNDLIDAKERTFELAYSRPGRDRTLKLVARVESKFIGQRPILFPTDNLNHRMTGESSFYSYTLGSARPPADRFVSPAYIEETGRQRPLFQELSPTGSGHPTGTTYVWVTNDDKNLYATMDFTLDNTYDGDKDYAKLYVRDGKSVKEFKVSVPETRWGRSHFIYTDKVDYEHKVYTFAIPLSELPERQPGKSLDIAFAGYGTAVIPALLETALAYDPIANRYLHLFMDIMSASESYIIGQFVNPDGTESGPAFPVAYQSDAMFTSIDLAYDSVNRRFLAVWSIDYDLADDSNIYGQLLNWDGTPMGGVIVLNDSKSYQATPTVAFDPTSQRFLVAWSDEGDADTTPGIYGQMLTAGGNYYPSGSPSIFPVYQDLDDWLIMPDAAFDTQSRQYMVVWSIMPMTTTASPTGQKKPAALPRASPGDIAGQMVDFDGNLVGSPFTIMPKAPLPNSLSSLGVVANDSVNHRFMVAWCFMMGIPNQAFQTPRIKSLRQFRQQLATNTKAAVPTYWIFGSIRTATGGVYFDIFPISLKADATSIFPNIAFDSNNRRFLIIFNSYSALPPAPMAMDLYGQFIDAEGMPLNTSLEENFFIGSNAFFLARQAIAYNSLCSNFLTGWLSMSSLYIERAVVGDPCPVLPTVETAPVAGITNHSAIGGGNVLADGGAAVTERGICWSPNPLPTIYDSRTSDGTGLGAFTSPMTGLLPATTFHVRAYAANGMGIAYGDDVPFTTFKYKVTFVAGSGGTLSGITPQYTNEGGSCTPVQAIAASGSFFVNWTGTGGLASTANPITVTNVTQDMVVTANFATLGLQAARRTEKAWIVSAEYADIELTIENMGGAPIAKFLLYRKVEGGEYELIKEILPGELQNGHYTYADLPLEKGKSYTFKLEARDAGGVLLGTSKEVTI